MTKPRVSISWSSGKDAALALHKVLEAGLLEVVNLHTTISQGLKRVGMHGTPLALVEAQARAIGLPLEVIEIPPGSTNAAYETAMLSYYASLRDRGIEGIVFGDIFLEDLRAYRDGLLQRAGLRAYYPLWQQATDALAAELQQLGFRAIICAATADLFDKEAVGSMYDEDFLAKLPTGCDPCGERGEFHTLVLEAPYFRQPVRCRTGEKVLKQYQLAADAPPAAGMWFVDLELASE